LIQGYILEGGVALGERMFNKLKNWHRVATHYDKTVASLLAFITIASIKLWMPFVHEF
jgi:transposase